MSISPPSCRAQGQGLCGIARCRGRGRKAVTCCSALGIFAVCLLSYDSRQAKKWFVFPTTPQWQELQHPDVRGDAWQLLSERAGGRTGAQLCHGGTAVPWAQPEKGKGLWSIRLK